MKFKPLINSIVLAWGWRRWAIALAAGALSALAMAPLNAWPILFLTFPTLVWLIDGAGVGRMGGVMSAAARAGGSASAISSPDSIGWATRSWSMRRPSAG